MRLGKGEGVKRLSRNGGEGVRRLSRGGGEGVKRLSMEGEKGLKDWVGEGENGLKDWVGEEEKGLKDWVRGGGGGRGLKLEYWRGRRGYENEVGRNVEIKCWALVEKSPGISGGIIDNSIKETRKFKFIELF